MKQANSTGKGQASKGRSNQGMQAKNNNLRASNGDGKSVARELSIRGSGAGNRQTNAKAGASNQPVKKSMAMQEKGKAPLEKFFMDALKDIYYAEQQLTKAIPKMEGAATTEELKEAFSDHLHQTQKQIKRLEKVFGLLGKKPEGKKCEAIEGIIKEADSIISETPQGSMTRDAALIIAAQKVEHYEIATYGGLVQLALTMKLKEVSNLLDDTLMEEEDTDHKLTQIAESHINMDAEHEGANYSWQKDGDEDVDEKKDEDMEEDNDNEEG